MRFKATVTMPLQRPKSFSKQFECVCRLCALTKTLVLVEETAQALKVSSGKIPWKLERALPVKGQWEIEASDRSRLDKFAAGHGC